MLSGETGRGLAFLGGDIGFGIIYVAGAFTSANDINNGGDGTNGTGLMLAGGIGMLAVDIWAIVDAVRVAKVNNLAFRNKNMNSYNFKIQPFVAQINNYTTNKPAAGISLKVTF